MKRDYDDATWAYLQGYGFDSTEEWALDQGYVYDDDTDTWHDDERNSVDLETRLQDSMTDDANRYLDSQG